jgi:phosphoglycolate phosphatase
MNGRRFRLLVFDWDGTLLDSVASIVGCTEATLRELGQPPVEEGKIRAAIGLGLRETVEAFCPGCDDQLFDLVLATYRDLWLKRYAQEPVLFEGVESLLGTLRREGYLLAVATAKTRGGLHHDLVRTGLAEAFQSTRTLDEAPGKPHPKMLLDIVEELGVSTGEGLMIGDTTHDLAMAADAGMKAVAVCSGCESRETLLSHEPLACLESVRELPAWLGALGWVGG